MAARWFNGVSIPAPPSTHPLEDHQLTISGLLQVRRKRVSFSGANLTGTKLIRLVSPPHHQHPRGAHSATSLTRHEPEEGEGILNKVDIISLFFLFLA